MSLCHNVTPIYEDNNKQFQASSPDEIALVEISERMGIKLMSRSTDSMII